MFGLRGSRSRPLWKRIEDDFVLGTCPRMIFGYITRDARGHWAAFTDDAGPVTVADDLEAAQRALWDAHLEAHHEACEPRTLRPSRRLSRDSGAGRPASDRTEFRMLRA